MLPHSVVRGWSNLLYRFPITVFCFSIFLSAILPLISLYFVPVQLSKNAEVGFDTKDTPYSGGRLAWKRLSYLLQTTNRVELLQPDSATNATLPASTPQKREITYEGDAESGRRKREEMEWIEETADYNMKRGYSTLQTRHKRNWGDSLISAFSNVPCYEAPIPLMEHLSQFVIELPSFSAVWDLSLLRTLCQMHTNIEQAITPFHSYTPYRNIWHISNFFACMSPNFLINCTELTDKDVKMVQSLVNSCVPFRNEIIDCRTKCETCTECAGVPKNCSTTMMFDLFFRLLPMDLKSEPFYLNTFLPVFTRMGYATQNIWLPMQDYDVLEDAIKNYTTTTGLKLKGILMEVKRDRLLSAAIKDSYFTLLAAGLVMSCVALHSRSLVYAIVVFLQLAFSVVTALAIYAHFTPDFPLLNLVIFVLLIAVGTDDAFLLYSHFPEKLTEETFYEAVSHTGATMFLTSFSTAVPFFVNILSNVIVFRCFGLFAGLTILVNYFLVISFLPTFLVLQKKYCNCLPSPPSMFGCLARSVRDVLPHVVIQGRFVWLSALSVLVIGCGVIAYNDLSLPQYNPLQLFTKGNVHEWYDNNAEPTFQFVHSKIAIPLHARLVWGIEPVGSGGRFRDASSTILKADQRFSLTSVPDVKVLARTLERFRMFPFVNHTEPYWPEQFLVWSSRFPCSPGFLCCNISSPIFTNAYLDYCLRNSTSYIRTQYNDTPIFDDKTFALIGYTALLPTQLRYSHRFRNLSASMDMLSENLQMTGGWFTTEWYLMSTWFDLQRSIVSDCESSVFISLAVVAVFAIVQLQWQAVPSLVTIMAIIVVSGGTVVLLGWEVGVLEAVILVLVVGLSFDFTLHYGASLPSNGCPFHRVSHSASLAATPVSLAALSSITAGAAMLFCQTHAFFQVGVFLVVSMSISWLFATFFFLPLLTFTLPKKRMCTECEIHAHSFPLTQKF